CAIKLARRLGQRQNPGRYHVVSALDSFHGRTLSALAATGQPAKQATFEPLPTGFSQVPFGDLAALEAAADEIGDGLAAVLLEPVQGEGGVRVAPDGYLPAVRDLCHRRGAIFMLDEVQTGLGRTGRWFGHEHFLGGTEVSPEPTVRPDVVTLAKALGNGMPIGACWARLDVAKAFETGDHATTFGGQPLAARAALTVLDVMEREQVPERARRAGARLRDGLARCAGISSVRGLGLLLAAELDGIPAGAAAAACLEGGLVVNALGDTALRLAPPLLVSDDEIDEALGLLGEALAACR
ncbi:MAG: aspartate aminotransferase family protein, partial [Acidimicrobiia bacterium]